MNTARYLLIVILCIPASPGMAEIYRWKDDSGKNVFGDTPPRDKTATAITIENTEDSGTQFATPEQIKLIEQNAKNSQRPSNASTRNTIDSHCRGYVSQLNKIEIYLQHTPTKLDQQKASDLRKLIKIECGNQILSQKYNDLQCDRYRTDLTRAEIFHQHTPTQRDQQKIKDLKAQIAQECQ